MAKKMKKRLWELQDSCDKLKTRLEEMEREVGDQLFIFFQSGVYVDDEDEESLEAPPPWRDEPRPIGSASSARKRQRK